MIYLLDINVLLSLVQQEHAFHRRAVKWIKTLDRDKDRLATCAISELGVVRILPRLSGVDYSVEEAQRLLMTIKAVFKPSFTLLSDNLGADHLPRWVKNPGQTTDGHLVALAAAHGATLATFDRKIHGALVLSE